MINITKKNRPILMGIINVTDDSFSDGGKYLKKSRAIKKAKELIKEGADIIDLGAESSGPGSQRTKTEIEIERLIPIIQKIRKISKIPLSIDTYKSKVAQEALKNGANIINDITALRGDPNMAKTIAESQCSCILMYSKDKSARTTIKNKKYDNVIEEIERFLESRIEYAKNKGIKKKNIIVDPGMGHFVSAIPKYSYEIIAKLNLLKKLSPKILIGISRKSFLGGDIKNRDQRGLPISAIAYLNGCDIIRTHEIAATKQFFKNIENE